MFPDVKLEKDAVTDPRICVAGMEGELPDFQLNDFNFYDKEGHMVALDANLIESGKEIKFSGIVRSEFLEDTDGLAILDAGPIKEWWITGFKPDEEMKVSTCYYIQGVSVSIVFLPRITF